MKAWDITIESNHDVDGNDWILRVRAEDCPDGGECDFRFHMPTDVALQLRRWVKLEIDSYAAEAEEARAAYKRGDDRWKPQEVRQAEARDLIDSGVYDNDPAKRAWAEGVSNGEIPL
jgi:hypothetical protein